MAMYRTRQELLATDWQEKINQAASRAGGMNTYAVTAAQLRADGYTEEEISGLLSESVWNHQRENYLRTGGGAVEVTAYPTYEEYVKAYIRYLSEQ